MALDASPTATLPAGRSPSRPFGTDHLSFDGDDDYPTGGTAAFQEYARSALSRDVDLKSATGLGFTAGAWTHICRYDQPNDKLLVFALSDGAEVANQADLSSVTFEVDLISE